MQEKNTLLPSELPQYIGSFKIIKSLGKGGMGEVFLAFDSKCQREVALKRIRSDLVSQEVIKNRFLKEAIITSKLAHPSIVPIYSLHEDEGLLYYIMPYLEGQTLKEHIRKAKTSESEGTVTNFLRIFMNLCQAVSFAHSKGYLHRDLKPENIIIGNFGQVYILDWGLVKAIEDPVHDEDIHECEITTNDTTNLTRPGKLLGTLAYMAPERVKKEPSSISSDIYALGVIFYQLLTLQLPFKRRSLKEFKANLSKEKLIDPTIIAPYRDIPLELSRVVKKCLDPDKLSRYQDTHSLILDLKSYIEGKSEWFKSADLNLKNKVHWEFQEHFVIPKNNHRSEWVSASVSKESFSGNTQLISRFKINTGGLGIGFLLSIPEALQREHPLEGFSLWLSARKDEPTKLFRSLVEVMRLEEVCLSCNEWHEVRLEKVDRHIHCFIDRKHIFSYISYLPLFGTHVGVYFKDVEFDIESLSVFVGSLSLKLSCLAIPDAFLANKDYSRALAEYRRIGYAFSGRQEAREALFLSGITLLEQAKTIKNTQEQQAILNLASEEFEKLRSTPGAPLEYLGKALIYETTLEFEEEIKCFALAIRRYPKHPLLYLLYDQILFRLHSKTKQNRLTVFEFALLTINHLKDILNKETEALFDILQKQLEPLFFLKELKNHTSHQNFALELAFWLNKPHFIEEIIKDFNDIQLIKTGLKALLYLGCFENIKSFIPQVAPYEFKLIELACQDHTLSFLKNEPCAIDDQKAFIILFFMQKYLDLDKPDDVIDLYHIFYKRITEEEAKFEFDVLLIEALLLKKDWLNLEIIFNRYPQDFLIQETTLLHFLYGCFLNVTESKEIAEAHFSSILDTPYPKIASLASHYLFSKGIEPSIWFSNAFPYEKLILFRQLRLFYECSGNKVLAAYYKKQIEAFFKHI
jgi:serine/threonine protein kinase